jgi:HAD superfamily hydrolase (TIGR01509 family)
VRARFVAFDLGNVLIDYTPQATVAALAAASGLALERALEVAGAFPDGLKRRFERGEIAPAAFAAEVSRRAVAAGGCPLRFEQFARGWTAAIAPRPGAAALVGRLGAGVGFAVWSNTDPLHFAFISPALPFLGRARALHLSFLAREAKPDRAFFEGALAGLAARAEEVVFVDDAPANVDAARALGIDAFAAATLAEAAGGLAARGLLAE